MNFVLQSIILTMLALVVGTSSAPVSDRFASLSLRGETSALINRAIPIESGGGIMMVKRSIANRGSVTMAGGKREEAPQDGIYSRSLEDLYDLYDRSLEDDAELIARSEARINARAAPIYETQLARRSIKSFFKKVWHGIKSIGEKVVGAVVGLAAKALR